MWTARPPTVRTRMEQPPSHCPQIDVTHFSSPLGARRADSDSSRKSANLFDVHPDTAVPAAPTALRARNPRRLMLTPLSSVMPMVGHRWQALQSSAAPFCAWQPMHRSMLIGTAATVSGVALSPTLPWH